jgi:hypothetical protein
MASSGALSARMFISFGGRGTRFERGFEVFAILRLAEPRSVEGAHG